MNLVSGSIRGGIFTSDDNTALVGVDSKDRDVVVLGARADDIDINEAGHGDLNVPIYSFENTGENTLLTVQLGAQRIIARGERHLRKDQGDRIGIRLNPGHIYLFDAETGIRIRGNDD